MGHLKIRGLQLVRTQCQKREDCLAEVSKFHADAGQARHHPQPIALIAWLEKRMYTGSQGMHSQEQEMVRRLEHVDPRSRNHAQKNDLVVPGTGIEPVRTV